MNGSQIPSDDSIPSIARTACGIEILCEDGPVIAVNKPSGVVVQGAPPGEVNLADRVRQYLKEKYEKPGNVYLGIPHRLDRPVSGVVVFSRNSKCAARLSEQFAKRTVKKVYRAILEKPPEEPEGTLGDWIERVPDQPTVTIRQQGHPKAKQARLSYRTLWTGRGRALVEIELDTGRMHQIRVQFASRGCPIVGDEQYGAKTVLRDGGTRAIGLHAYSLTLQHPIRYEELTITAPPPEFWSDRTWGIPAEYLR